MKEKPKISDLLKNHLKHASQWIERKKQETNGVLGQDLVLKVTYGPVGYTKLIAGSKEIEGIMSFRGGDGKVINVPPERYKAAWDLVPDDMKAQLTEVFSDPPDIEVRIEYTIYYRGSRVGQRLNQGADKRGFTYPSELKNGPSFYTHEEATKAALKLKNYINSLKEKKNNFNHQ
jgi:hypothetical protein